jgi:hypothetical protein
MPVSTRLNSRCPTAATTTHSYSLRPAPAAGFYAEHVDDEADVQSAATALITMRSSTDAPAQQQLRRSSRLATRK